MFGVTNTVLDAIAEVDTPEIGTGGCAVALAYVLANLMDIYGVATPVPVPTPVATKVTPTVFADAPIKVKSVVPTVLII